MFNLESFDAASVFGDAMDATVTGYLANGSTRTATYLTASRSLQTLNLGWTGLTRVEINFTGGQSPAYGALDNFVLTG
jgi:hypothetical protein